ICDSSFVHPLRPMGPCQEPIGSKEVRFKLKQSLGLFQQQIVAVNYPIHEPHEEINHGGQGIDLQRQARLGYGFVGPLAAPQEQSVMLVSGDVVRVELNRAFETVFTSRPVSQVPTSYYRQGG